MRLTSSSRLHRRISECFFISDDFSTELTQNSNIHNLHNPCKDSPELPAEWDIWKIKSVSCEAGDLLHLHDPPRPLEYVQEQLAAENQGCMTAGQKCY